MWYKTISIGPRLNQATVLHLALTLDQVLHTHVIPQLTD